MAKERVNFTIEKAVIQAFRAYCEERHYKMSTIIEKLIREEIGAIRRGRSQPHHHGVM